MVLLAKLPINKKLTSPTINTNKPNIEIAFIGLVEKDTIPPNEYLTNFIKDHFEVPYNLFSGVYGTYIVLNPTQEKMPFKNLVFFGYETIASLTHDLNTLKSLAPGSNLTSDILLLTL